MKSNSEITIMIVEDNKLFNLALKTDIETTFQNMPIKVFAFETGEKCMEQFANIQPDIVILDYNLDSTIPNAANGIKILDWVKKENVNTNVIMLTSEDDIEIAVRSFKHGASDYVVKTDTKFRKVNYSLGNIFKIIAAGKEAKKYKRILFAFSTCIALFIGTLILIQIFNPALLR